MSKNYLLFAALFLAIAMFFASCEDDGKPDPAFMPNSSGIADEVLIVSDQEVWTDSLKKAMEYLLYRPYPVLPQYEPTIKYTYIDFADFKSMFKRHRNIIFLADLSSTSPLSDFVTKNLGEDYTAKALNDPEFFYGLRRDVWAKPQVLYFVFSNSEEALLNQIQARGQELVSLVLENDTQNKYAKTHQLEGHNYEIEQRLKERFGIGMFIPESFFIAYDDGDLMWLRRETDEAGHNIFIHSVPQDSMGLGLQDIIAERDEIGKIVESDVDSAYMVSDTILAFQYNELRLNDRTAIETRGLWRLKYDFMGGPFVNYAIPDPGNERTIMIDGWVYAPKVKKKPELRRVETIMSTVTFNAGTAQVTP